MRSPSVAARRDAEWELVLACVRGNPTSDIVREVADWSRVVQLATIHGVLPLVHRRLRQEPAVPPAIRVEFERLAQQTVHHNLLLTARLLEIIELLREHGIDAVPYKGPTLTDALYGDVSLRPFDDLDVFVRRGDVIRACAVLAKRGYVVDRHIVDMPASSGGRRMFFHWLNEMTLRNEDRFSLELHWDVVPHYLAAHLDLDALWARTTASTYRGVSMRSFSNDDLLMLLCVHASMHQWRQLKFIADIARLVAPERSLAWTVIQNRATATGVARMVRVGLLLALEHAGATLPEPIARWARADDAAVSLAQFVADTYARDRGETFDYWERAGFHIALRERWSDKLRYVARVCSRPEPAIWTRLPLPRALTFLYPIVHLLRFVQRTAGGGIRTVRAVRAGIRVPAAVYSRH